MGWLVGVVVLEDGDGGFCMGVVLVGSGVQQKWSRTLLLWCRSVLLPPAV